MVLTAHIPNIPYVGWAYDCHITFDQSSGDFILIVKSLLKVSWAVNMIRQNTSFPICPVLYFSSNVA